jgi:uncharacterized protein
MLKWAGLVMGMVIGSNVYAAAKLSVPQEIVVVAINNKEINSGLFRSQKNYNLDEGKTTLHVRYQQYFDHRNGQHDILKSGIVEIETDNIQDNQAYRLELINAPKSFEEAQKYEDHPMIALLDQNNKVIAKQEGVNFKTKSLLESVLKKDDDSNKKSRDEKNGEIQSVTNLKNSDRKSSIKSKDQQMTEIWKSATKQERQKFMTWLAEQ